MNRINISEYCNYANMNLNHRKRQGGFTLIELLVVIAVFSTLAAIVVTKFMNSQLRAKIAKAQAEMREIGVALENYRIESGVYPPWKNENGSNRNNPGFSARLYPLTTPIGYLSNIPQDPFALRWERKTHSDLQNPAYDTYQYIDARSTVFYPVYREDLVLGISFRCSEWSLISDGPDGFMTFGGGAGYALTNGLRSLGDIIRVGPRTSYPCDNSLIGK